MDTQTAAQTQGGGPNPVDETGLCLLSLDGGGVRGLSSLRILKSMMTKLNDEREKISLPRAKPCEIFDLIGGTSTGGLIAIMLGRLQMDVDECIVEYTQLLKSIFEKSGLPINIKGKIKGRFDSTVLESAIKQTIAARGLDTDKPLNDGEERGCKVFVCATSVETKGTIRLKSYKVPDELDDHGATILEAALATSAATSFFEPIQIGTRKYVDGALGANNPIHEVWNEALNVWSPDLGDLKPLVKCIVSVGTGDPGVQPINDSAMQFFSKTMVEIATETEKTAETFISHSRGLYGQGRYFRFNVQQGLQGVGLAEYKKQGDIEAATDRYLTSLDQKFRSHHNQRSLIEASKVTLEPRLLLPFERNKKFVGRSLQLKQLTLKIHTKDQCQRIAIVGLGGVGKTQIALEIAYKIQEMSPDFAVFWVPASDASAFEQAYLNIGLALQIPGINDGKANVKQLVRDELRRSSSRRWLMVIDNADDIRSFFKDDDSRPIPLDEYLPDSTQGSIVFTTRNMAAAVDLVGDQAGDDVIIVEEMGFNEAESLLESYLIRKELMEDNEATIGLLDLLTYLPLAIAQAASYINKNRIAISRYISLYKDSEENSISLLSEDFYRSTKNPVATTWQISFDQIKQDDPLAAEYLSFMSCIDPQDIPESILPPQRAIEKDKALGTLKAYSFLTLRTTMRDGSDSHDVHRLVHLATRNWLRNDPENGDQLTIWSGKALDQLAEIFPTGRYENKEKWTSYLPHVRCVLASRHLPEGHEKSRWTLLYNVSWCLRSSGDYSAAAFMARRDLELREAVLGQQNSDTLSSLSQLAVVLEHQGKYEEAEQMSRQVLKGRETELGVEHPDTLTSVSHLAWVLHSQGKYEEAEMLNRRALNGREKLGLLLEDTLTSVNNLAGVLRGRAQYQEAEALNRRALEGRQKVLGLLHPDTLTTIDDLAWVLENQHKYAAAELLIRQALEGRKQALGAQHPDTLTTMSKLALVLPSRRRFKAAEMHRQVLQKREQVLGLQHPDTLTSVSNLADVLYHLGNYEEAEKMCRRALESNRATLGDRHPSTLRSASNLAGLLQTQCKLEEAEMMNREVLARYEESLGPKHRYTLTSMSNLAELLQEQDSFAAAEDMHRQVLKGRLEAFGAEHQDTLASVSNLAAVLSRQKNYDAAEVMHRKALDGYEKILGPEHEDTLLSVYHIAHLLHTRKQYDDAIGFYERACAGYEKELGPQHLTTLSCARHYEKMLKKMDEEVSRGDGAGTQILAVVGGDSSGAPAAWKTVFHRVIGTSTSTSSSIDWSID